MLKAVVFDFEGIILESMDLNTQALRVLFGDHPYHLDRIVRLHL